MARFCSHCGAEMVDTAAFCPKCGRATAVQSTFAGPSEYPPPPSASTASVSGLPANIAALLCYFVIPAIVFLFLEPFRRDRFVRFHAFQAIFLAVVFLVINAVSSAIPLLNLLLVPLFGLAETILAIVCMIKAWQNQIFKLPYLGGLAEKQANA